MAALTVDGVLTVQCTNSTVNADTSYDFARSYLIPNIHQYDGIAPNSVVVLDNCSIHHVSEMADLFEQAGRMVIFLSPCSPDFDPIESAFSFVKSYLKKHDIIIAGMSDVTPLIKDAFDNITSELAQSWIKYRGC